MRILLDNVNVTSKSGPNSFGRQLTVGLQKASHEVYNTFDLLAKSQQGQQAEVPTPDVQLTFIQRAARIPDVPLVQRLDGIYYNSDPQYGDWFLQNAQIQDTYNDAKGIIFQSPFSKRLVESFFGEKDHEFVEVINNGVDLDAIASIQTNAAPELDQFSDVWMCASSWRPHKRLGENIRYFLEHANETTCLVVAGSNAGAQINDPRILYTGELDWVTLVSLYKRASTFIHLAYHDNCPNVIVDARASGCKIVCASCAGSTSIAGSDAIVIDEDDWEPEPIELYKPPKLDFTRARQNGIDSNIDITDVTHRYVEFLERCRG